MSIKKNKIMAAITAVILTIITTFSFTTSADNSSLVYVKYNAKTGSYLGSYTLNAMSPSDNSRSIIGFDDREIDWSKSGVVKLLLSNGTDATGFVVDEHVVATAGHCAKDVNISEILLFDSNGNISMRATPVEKHYLQAYKNEHTAANDYALITVKENLSNYMCFNLGTINSYRGTVYVTGFPGELNYDNVHGMYTGSGSIQSVSSKLLTYNADTTNGESGSPVYVAERYNGQIYYSVIAVHTAGGTTSNTGTRMTFDLLHFYLNNSNISY